MVKFSKKQIVIASIVVLLLGGGVAFAILRNSPEKETQSTSDNQQTSEETVQTQADGSQTATSNSSPATNPDDKTSSTGNAGSGNLMAPAGSFVSNHNASLGSIENSICRTTPGATCEIRFTNGGTVRTLGAKQAGSDGSVSWDWKVQDYLSTGTWEIEAIAKLGTKSSTTKDTIKFTVSS